MTAAEFCARINAMLDAEYEALGGDAFRARFGDATVKKVVVRGLAKRMQAEAERGVPPTAKAVGFLPKNDEQQ
jgi:hypothetical protein